MGNMNHPFDARLEHRAIGSAAITAAATTLATITERAQQRTQYRTIVNVEAIKTSAGNELAQVVIELSNDAFTTVHVAAVADFGHTSVRQSGAPTSVAGDGREILWTTEQGETKYAASRIRVLTSGTAPSITLGCFSTILGDI